MRGSIVSGTTLRGRAPGISASSGAPKPVWAGAGAAAGAAVRGGGGRIAKPLRLAAVMAGAAIAGAAIAAGAAATGAPHFRHSVHEPGTM